MLASYNDNHYATDQLGRPIIVIRSGIGAVVVDAENASQLVTVQVFAGGQALGEPIELPLQDTYPACVHCGERLEESTSESPGECRQRGCFMERID